MDAIAGRSPGGRLLRRRREMVLVYSRQRLRGTAALQVATDQRCHERMGHCRPAPGVRSVGAVKWCWFTAGNGCEGPQPSKPPPIIVATNGWAIAGRSPGAGGRPLRRRREMVLIYGGPRLRGTAALQAATDHRCHERLGHCRPIPWRASAPSAPWKWR
jgi:hypothetical protein